MYLFQQFMQKREDGNFEAIKMGDNELSIQASSFHYCSPRKNLSLDQYEAFK